MRDDAEQTSDDDVTVVGIGADGWSGLGERAQRLINSAEVLIGSQRQLDLIPALSAERVTLPRPLLPGLQDILQTYASRRLVLLASGDPMRSGIGSTLVRLLGTERVHIHPYVSSVSLALARMGWSAESTDIVSLVGRDPHGALRAAGPGRRFVVLSTDGTTPATLAKLLADTGYPKTVLTVFGNLGTDDESRTSATASTWEITDVPPLNVICVSCERSPTNPAISTSPGLPDDSYDHDGQLTKRELRASALARLMPVPDQLLWDVGSGTGSVAIEWLRTDARCRAVAIEERNDRAERIAQNAHRLGVPGLEVVHGRAPEALSELPVPDAIFIGGGATVDGLLEHCWNALATGGRLVAHGVTLETERLLASWYERYGGELIRIGIERAEPLGSFTSWQPSRPVISWSVVR